MRYSNIISDMTWSYSRLTSFESCPYKFFLSYIKRVPKKRQFFSDYGSFAHEIIEKYLLGELKKDELDLYYLTHFNEEVRGKAPTKNIFKSYFEQGLQYFSSIDFPYKNPIGVEKEIEFELCGIHFVGIIDCITKDAGSLVILDNKSRSLKPRSTRTKPTVSDTELDEYLRQLYLYSVPMKELFYTYPKRLEFNCFRMGQLISEPFREDVFEKTKIWAVNTVKTITDNEDWSPKMDYWKCNHLCDVCDSCEYFQTNRGGRF